MNNVKKNIIDLERRTHRQWESEEKCGDVRPDFMVVCVCLWGWDPKSFKCMGDAYFL